MFIRYVYDSYTSCIFIVSIHIQKKSWQNLLMLFCQHVVKQILRIHVKHLSNDYDDVHYHYLFDI